MEQLENPPSNFRSVVGDFTRDLSLTFPEYIFLWEKWTSQDISDEAINELYKYSVTIYPERFFDILYQNDDIFKPDSTVNTNFLPNVDFKLLYNCDDISEKTKKAIWKYLQLLLFSIVGGIKDKTNFGETMNLFEGIDEKELQEKLSETMGGLTDFFNNMNSNNETGENTEENTDGAHPNMENFKNMFQNMPEMPNVENMQDHLKSLFGGKIGKLAREIAEEVTGEISGLLDGDMDDVKSTQDVMKKFMKNPKKIMEIMKKVGGKLDNKMKSGEISRDEIMKEAGDLLGKMKDMGGNDQLKEMFKNIAKNMGGGMGKNMRIDTGAIDRMTKQNSMRERMKAKLESRKLQQAIEIEKLKNDRQKQVEPQNTLAANYSLETKNSPDNLVFRIDGEGSQEKSFIHPDLLKEMEMQDKKKADGQNKADGQKKKKNKKKK